MLPHEMKQQQQQQHQQQQQYDYNAYHNVNGGQWHQSATSDYVDHHLRQQQQQQQQTPFIKSESVYTSVAKTEIFDHAQQQQQPATVGLRRATAGGRGRLGHGERRGSGRPPSRCERGCERHQS